MGGALLELEQVTKWFGNGRHLAVDSVSLRVAEGEVYALLGPNGAGKTTLIRLILGLLRPDGGSVRVAGRNLRENPEAVKRMIGFVPERVRLYDHLTALETLEFFAAVKRVPGHKAGELLDRVGLTAVADKRVGQFSKGMLQRLGLAQALLGAPPLLILDEPSSGLDPQGTVEFRKMLRSCNEEGTTIFLASHLLGEVEELARGVGVIDDGQLMVSGPLDELKTRNGAKPEVRVRIRHRPAKSGEAQQTLPPWGDAPGKTLEAELKAAQSAGAERVEPWGDGLAFRCPPALEFKILAAIEASGGEILDLHIVEPTLEDLYFSYVRSSVDTVSFSRGREMSSEPCTGTVFGR